MSVIRIDSSHTDNGQNCFRTKLEYQGLSSDAKPTLAECQSGSTFYAVDTKIGYVWHINAWYEV